MCLIFNIRYYIYYVFFLFIGALLDIRFDLIKLIYIFNFYFFSWIVKFVKILDFGRYRSFLAWSMSI